MCFGPYLGMRRTPGIANPDWFGAGSAVGTTAEGRKKRSVRRGDAQDDSPSTTVLDGETGDTPHNLPHVSEGRRWRQRGGDRRTQRHP